MADEKKTGAKALKEFFGLKDGQDLRGFLAEIKELSPEERKALAEGIENGTLDY